MTFHCKNYCSPGQWLSCLEHRPVHQKVVGLIPSQGTYLGFGFDSQSGHIPRLQVQSLIRVHMGGNSFSLSLKSVSVSA